MADKANCAHDDVEVALTCPDCGQQFESRKIKRSDFESQQVQQLPNREAMSLITANVAAPINLALAANILSDNSTATATATQTAPITQIA